MWLGEWRERTLYPVCLGLSGQTFKATLKRGAKVTSLSVPISIPIFRPPQKNIEFNSENSAAASDALNAQKDDDDDEEDGNKEKKVVK